MAIAERSLVTNAVNEEARPLEGKPSDYDPLLKLIHEARTQRSNDAGKKDPGTRSRR
jgi:hypothetical protein